MRTLRQIDLEVQREQLWAHALASAAVMLIWQLYFEALSVPASRLLMALRLAHAGLMVAVIVWLLIARRTVGARRAFVVGLLVILPVPVILWVNQDLKLASGWPELFASNRVAMILVAILFPGTPRLVLPAVTVVAATGVLHVAVWRWRGVPIEAGEEPWLLLFHWVIACLIVFLRGTMDRLRLRYQRARAALAALAQLGTATRALRDGANTPLQTIDTIAFLQRSLDPRLEESSARLQRSSTQLRRMLDSLKYADFVEWEEDDLSFRAEKRLAALQEQLLRDASLIPKGDPPGAAR